MSHCPQCNKLMRGVCRYCQPQEYIDVVQQAFMDFADELPQRTWVGLTDEEKSEIKKQANYNWETTAGEYASKVQDLTEAKLKEKNT